MSHRPHPLRQSHTLDYPGNVNRQSSTASSIASSGYSLYSETSRASTQLSSVPSGYSLPSSHKRGKSDGSRLHQVSFGGENQDRKRDQDNNIYSMTRQSLRPLPQAPASPSPTVPTTASTPSPPRPSYRHERTQSVDSGKLSHAQHDGGTSPTPLSRTLTIRPNSMLLGRSDSVRGSTALPHANESPPTVHSAALARPDLERLGRSSTSQLRTLSKLAQSESAEEFAITTPAQEVVGLRGRRRLQRADKSNASRVGQRTGGYGWEGRNWMDKQRQFLQAYEYLCHIGEAKEWIEDVIHRAIPPIVELEEALRDGVTLAEVVEALNPDRRFRIFRHQKLQFRHSDNIAIFFRYLDEVELPDLFRFELIDLYEKKNIPKVIYCIHALSWLLFRKGIVDFRIGNLVGQLEFEHHELEAMQKGLDKLGVTMPSFGNMGADFGVEPATPEPEETEEERIDRELGENEESIVDLQAQARGAVVRMRLGDTMQQLWDVEGSLIDLQSRIRADFTRQIIGYRLQMRRFAVDLQSLARGFLVRNRMASKERFWKMLEPDILELQSLIRAKKVRDEVRDKRSQLARHAGPVRKIQAALRGFLVRKELVTQQQETVQTSGEVLRLQAAVRGMLLRGRVADDLEVLGKQTDSIISLQAAARALLTRDQISREQGHLQGSASQWTALQALIRGKSLRNEVDCIRAELSQHIPEVESLQAAIRGKTLRSETAATTAELNQHTAKIEHLQAIARGNSARFEVAATKAELAKHANEIEGLQAHARASAVRRDVAQMLDDLNSHEAIFIDLQSLIRGMLERHRVAAEQDALSRAEPKTTKLQARIRGYQHRQQHAEILEELKSHTPAIQKLQGLARAMMVRGDVFNLISDLEEEEGAIVEMQAAAKAFVVRAKFEEKKRFFNENMQKVVKIQSLVRAKIQGDAYKSLTHGKDPPVNAVKNFVHLLNDSDFDFNEEMEFERMRKTVVQQVRQNEMLEQYIDQLDIKIALLVKNKITLDEVVRHQSNYGGHSIGLLANSSISSTNHFDLKALNKSSRKKLESYQQLFFNLQTQPQYLARLFKRIREQGTPEKECKRIEHLMMGLFGYAQKRREEYYLLKLLARSMREEVEGSRNLQDYLRGNFFWTKLLANYSRSPRDRKYLRELLGPIVRDNIVEDPALDLESDPLQIYRAAINNEELRTGRPSRRPLDVPREMAIKDPETRDLFIDHLRDLREICDQYLLALEDLLPKMPYGLRFLCRQLFEALCQQFKKEPQHHHLQIVTNWLWRLYMQPAVIAPENVGVIEKQLSPLQKRNLGEVAKVLGQIASGRPFGGENIYLQPLNAFVGESTERLAQITHELISVPDAERNFDIDEFNDLYSKNKPTLYIKMTDIFAIHNLVAGELPTICPNRDDVLREILQDLGSAKNNESEMLAAGSSDIQMYLTPKLHDIDDPEAEVKALFMETKRCILYIIRVQTGANLLEILVKPVNAEDEHKWRSVLHDDFAKDANTRGAYSDAHMVDVTRMSYYDLKRTALENILRLEHMGRISKHNYYQDILNAIALDIRTKSRRRVQRQRELDGVRSTLANLHEKAKYLELQRKSYDDYIESAMATLQKNKGKKRFLLPFTKQYNHQRELERSGRVPKFGSYKYSARALAEKGVLVGWSGVTDWERVNLTISCDEVGVFSLEGSRGHIQMPGASALIPIEDLLQAQFEAHQFMNLFEGSLKLNVNLLLHLLYKKFYRTQ
ncbi:GTPase-activator protein for Ras-like GTPase [Colletotrichum higginsianum IMI 349063]|uniref:GTPase-activator protein for Ras-like GTPase n=3 Tax=Colletotrichum higginsianum TaxID=80884 RepID=A0A1B7YE26_COLHI|nr:GTPase-activator protein for Ras-like GTPase [Colletotrichum higginsianum IMI 349063]OBR10279.1 GTPase-activator protein for Ras-like GTPase [Colletotrichum higginsianum IMI 349063]